MDSLYRHLLTFAITMALGFLAVQYAERRRRRISHSGIYSLILPVRIAVIPIFAGMVLLALYQGESKLDRLFFVAFGTLAAGYVAAFPFLHFELTGTTLRRIWLFSRREIDLKDVVNISFSDWTQECVIETSAGKKIGLTNWIDGYQHILETIKTVQPK